MASLGSKIVETKDEAAEQIKQEYNLKKIGGIIAVIAFLILGAFGGQLNPSKTVNYIFAEKETVSEMPNTTGAPGGITSAVYLNFSRGLTAGSNGFFTSGVKIESGVLNMTGNNITGIGNEGDFNVNDSDSLDGEDGGYYLDNTNNYTTGITATGTDTITLTLTRLGLTDLTATFDDRYEADTDTNASTACSGTDTYLAGDGTCQTDTNTQLDDQQAEANVDIGGNNVTNVTCIVGQNGGEWCFT